MDWMKKTIMRLTDRIESSCALGAIRQGMIMLIPLLVAGYMSLMFASLPVPAYQEFLTRLWDGRVVEILQFIHKGVNQFFAVILAVTTSISYSMIKRKRTGIYVGNADIVILAIITLAAIAGYSGIQYDDFSVSSFSNMNTFTALFVALISGKLFFAIKDRRAFRLKKQGTNTDSVYLEAVEGILPAIFILLFFALFHQLLRIIFDVNGLQELMERVVNHVLQSFDNGLGAGVAVVFITHFLWFFGMHGHNVLDVVIKQNFTDVTAGIFSKTFQDVFVIMGGTGAVLCLVIAILLFAKKKSVRNLAVMASPSVLFNISEIVLFGVPVILNPIFLIPFMLVPLVNCLITYAAIYIGLVPHIINEVEWTTPVLLSGYQATGSWRGAVLQAFCLVIGVFIYRPFVHMFEEQSEKRLMENVRKLVAELQREEESNSISALTQRDDEIGNVARLLAAELEEAVRKNELFLMYQPQVDCNGRFIGAEALIRWQHPIVGFIYPPLIIQLAKEKKILHNIEEYIFEEASKAIVEIGNHTDSDFKVSVNITNTSLEWDGIEKCIDNCMKKYNIANERFCLEITEQDALSSSIDIIDKLNNIKSKGHKFLIDDFGMGHTSLVYLQTNYFDVVKLDRALTKDILENQRNSDIIASIVYLGQSLHFTTIAEWVETEEQRDELKKLGCDAFQGYLYSKPLELDDMISWLEENAL
ncbi:MAG: PTS sugar transporter subunit IIC/EAL domain-containing protein [Lachnospiraceae bacterium]